MPNLKFLIPYLFCLSCVLACNKKSSQSVPQSDPNGHYNVSYVLSHSYSDLILHNTSDTLVVPFGVKNTGSGTTFSFTPAGLPSWIKIDPATININMAGNSEFDTSLIIYALMPDTGTFSFKMIATTTFGSVIKTDTLNLCNIKIE
jgi:hypothetical protein